MLQIKIDIGRINNDLLSKYDISVINSKLTEIYNFFNIDNENDFYKIVNKFSTDNLDNLYDSIHFYNYIDLVVDKRATPLRALLVIFFIEGAVSKEKNLDFYNWLIEKTNKGQKLDSLVNKNHEELNKIMELLYLDYKKEYGSIRTFKKLFQTCLTFDEKIELLRSFSSIDDNNNGFHFCHNAAKECCDYNSCYLLRERNNVDLCVMKIADMLFSFRSGFAHGDGVNHFTYSPKEDYEPLLIGYYDNKLLEIRLTHDRFDELSRKMVYRYWLTK